MHKKPTNSQSACWPKDGEWDKDRAYLHYSNDTFTTIELNWQNAIQPPPELPLKSPAPAYILRHKWILFLTKHSYQMKMSRIGKENQFTFITISTHDHLYSKKTT